MSAEKILILGGVAAGTKVAAKLKRENRDFQVTILTAGKDISYAGCGLPYYVGDVIHEKGELIVNTPEKFKALTGVEVLTLTEATAVHPDTKTVDARNLETGETASYNSVSYTHLIRAVETIDLLNCYVYNFHFNPSLCLITRRIVYISYNKYPCKMCIRDSSKRDCFHAYDSSGKSAQSELARTFY